MIHESRMKNYRSFFAQIWKMAFSSGSFQAITLVVGNMAGTFISAIGLILISRLLGPAQFGEFAAGFSLMSLLTRFQGLGMQIVIPKTTGALFKHKNWQSQVAAVLQTALSLNLTFSFVFVVVGVLGSDFLSSLLKFDSTIIVLGAFVFAAVTVLFELVTVALQSLHRFVASAGLLIIQSLLKLAIASLAFWFSFTQVNTLFWLFYAAPLVSVVVGGIILVRSLQFKGNLFSFSQVGKLWPVMQHAALTMATLGVIDYVDILLVKSYLNSYEAGLYSGVSQLSLALGVIGASLGAVLNARVSRYTKQSEANDYLHKTVYMVLASVVGFAAFVPLASLAIYLTVGEAYLPALPYLHGLAGASFIYMATVPFVAFFYAQSSARYFSLSAVFQLILVIGGGLLFIPWFGLSGAVGVKLATRFAVFIFTLAYLRATWRKNAMVS